LSYVISNGTENKGNVVSGGVWRISLVLLAVAWTAASVLSWSLLLSHTYQPVVATGGINEWPSSLEPTDRDGRIRVILFAHPLCPCTRATIAELDEALGSRRTNVNTTIVFVTAGLAEPDIYDSPTVAAARRLLNVTLRFEDNTAFASRIGATTSGELFVFDGAGKRVFHGGITAGRGHRGRSPGRERFEQALEGILVDHEESPLFGCRLPASVPPTS
jgi:hypothetical protein